MYRWIDHTGELELEIVSDSEAGVLREAVRALTKLIAARERASAQARIVRLELSAPDRPALLAALMDEVLYRAEVEHLVPERLDAVRLRDGALVAELLAHPGRTSSPVKAVTYHNLTFEPADNGWRATVVLDV
jgi:SHS2 domain-containing protein